ncbi:hypothetical protein PGT21_032435 [Puccinia graminis f. sp. tritici]|uniref:Uncharacterized protein n=1 Tax=Puccinia graminis f. sp. tritici TaxID=56615 RepID=A0A5B0PBJ0_PUCGR|nr:hypothetical protein PGTUg99_015390 [Puccinia graminis f. sp. tritici]KAA1104821.1 hypothetical protein PGT21_032435 [Puccinia graminis f. sp. tritici]
MCFNPIWKNVSNGVTFTSPCYSGASKRASSSPPQRTARASEGVQINFSSSDV